MKVIYLGIALLRGKDERKMYGIILEINLAFDEHLGLVFRNDRRRFIIFGI